MNPAKSIIRRLSALLVADLVDYTAQVRANEKATLQKVKTDLTQLFIPKIKSNRGRLVKTTGDGLLAEFASVVDGVECAIEIQPLVAAQQAGVPPEKQLRYRIARHVGDIIVEPGDIYGDGVNLVMRLQALADPGGIVVSDDVYRQVRGKLNVTFENLGERAVKGIDEPVRIYRIVMDGAVASQRKAEPAPVHPPISGISPIAVLAFENLSGDPERRYFSDGITNDIVTDLSKFSQLLVLASHNVVSGRHRADNVQEVSRKLGVRYILEGSVQNEAGRIRINVQLIEGDSGRTLWAERYDRPIGEIFELKDEIVQTIVGTLVTRVHQSEHQRVLRNKPENLEAYDAYLRGRAAFAVWTKDSNLVAQGFFKRAIELDPNFALAYGYMSYTLVQARLGGWDQSRENLDCARELAQKAIELGPTEYDNYWSLAAAHLVSRDFDRAMAAYGRASELNPNSPNLLVDLAEALVYVDRVDDAISNIKRAMKINPMYPDWYLWTLGIALYHSGEYEQSVAALTKGNPPNLARRILAASYVRLGRIEEAMRTAGEFLKQYPDYTLRRESLWPYKNPQVQDALIADLRRAGLPDNANAKVMKGQEQW
jgi:adenylate cyclase